MRLKMMIVGATVATAIAGVVHAGWVPAAVAVHVCPPDVNAADRSLGITAIHEGRVTGGAGGIQDASRDIGSSVVRHVAASPAGTAYVRDRAGHDEVVVATTSRVTTLPQPGEVYHPAWSSDGALAWGLDDRLVLRSPAGRITSVRGPRPGGIVLSPIFDGSDVVAAVSAAQTTVAPEDEWSEDLWRYDTGRGRWARLTAFPAGADRWTAIETPMLAPDGSIEFVMVQGRGSRTGLPSFSLWRLTDGGGEHLASLDGERYLAGYAGDGTRLWNVPDRTTATWLIQRDTPNGLATVGCGAVAVDPMDGSDPDRTGHAAPSPVRDAETGPRFDSGDPMEAALLVGDLGTETAADVVAQQVARAYGGSLPVDVVEGGHGSRIVAPQRWAVLVRLPATTDGAVELHTLRGMLPALAQHMWVVVP
jgi:hypothetical protein